MKLYKKILLGLGIFFLIFIIILWASGTFKQVSYYREVYEGFNQENKTILFTYDDPFTPIEKADNLELLRLKLDTYDKEILPFANLIKNYSSYSNSSYYWNMIWIMYYDLNKDSVNQWEHRLMKTEYGFQNVIYNDLVSCYINIYNVKCLENKNGN